MCLSEELAHLLVEEVSGELSHFSLARLVPLKLLLQVGLIPVWPPVNGMSSTDRMQHVV